MVNTVKFPARHAIRRKDWIWMLAYAIAIIAIGVLAFAFPFPASLSIGIMLAAALIMYGTLLLIAGCARRTTDWLEILFGLVSLLVGGVTLSMPLTATVTLVWMTGAWFVVSALFGFVAAFRADDGRIWQFLSALLNFIFGAILFFSDPVSALAYASFLLGFSLLFRGAFLLVTAIRLRALIR